MNLINSTFFSVIIPTHNRPSLLQNAVSSVLTQKIKNFEIIIINDASSEDYTEFRKKFSRENRIQFFDVDFKNRSKTRNFGIEMAEGKWICFLDDDDIFLDNHFEILARNIDNHPEIKILHTYSIIKRGNNIHRQKMVECDLQGPNRIIENPFHIHSACFSKDIVGENRFNSDLYYLEDLDFWFRLSINNSIYSIPEYTNEYIFHSNNTADFGNLNSMLNRLKALQHFKNNYQQLNSTWLKSNLIKQHKIVCDLYFNKKKYLKFLKYFFIATFSFPEMLISKWVYSKLKIFTARVFKLKSHTL